MQDKPSQAVRRGRGSSMWLALEAVQKGEADCAVSAGNTGALMAMSKLILKTMPGIERPVIAGQWPTVRDNCIVLDLGANIGATARQLADFALMGAAMARALFHIERPRVGLLNIGVEEIKGIEEVRQAHAWLKENGPAHRLSRLRRGRPDRPGHRRCGRGGGLRRQHRAEDRRGHGQADGGLRAGEALTSSLAAKLGALLAQGGLRALSDRMDPRRFNGGPFLGLNGIVIKSHGGTDAFGFASAIGVGYDMAESDLIAHLAADLEALHGKISAKARPPEAETGMTGRGSTRRPGRGARWQSSDP